jgi:alpha-D-ribose 1-methylphosphonate 5-triphosphate diphosphatase
MNRQTVLTNARLVLDDEVVHGSVVMEGERIIAVDQGGSGLPGAVDLEGDYLLPGLVELHTDNLEKHFTPRPGVKWPQMPAIFAHDAAIAGAGITTVFNAVATGDVLERSGRVERFGEMAASIRRAADSGLTRAEHLMHIRCELAYELTLENFHRMLGEPLLRLVSVMDHSPGQRQFANIDKYREYYQGKYHLGEDEIQALVDRQTDVSQRVGRQQREAIAGLCREHGLALASHDDATVDHVREAVGDGVSIAEFPTTIEAARASREHGLHVLMGAPNVVRGFSHSGNVSARDLADGGLLDTLSSDYVPNSLLHAAFILEHHIGHIGLPQAIAMVSRNPAHAAGLHDRGRVAEGLRADLVQVKLLLETPVVRQVWRAGQRVI